MLARLQAGGAVELLGDGMPLLRVSGRGIELLREGRWALLSTERIAGYRVRNGHLMIDEDPQRPTLWMSEPLGRIDNSDAFVALLDRLAPGKDLDAHPYPFRVSGLSAATHEPGGMVSAKRRVRVTLLLVGAAVPLLALLVLAVFLRDRSHQTEVLPETPSQRAHRSLDAREEALAKASVPTIGLGDACRGKPINLLNSSVELVRPDEGSLGSVAMPAFVRTDRDGWGSALHHRYDWMEYAGGNHLLARPLEGTTIQAGQASKARLHVQVYDGTGETLVCEGVVEQSWGAKDLDGRALDDAALDGLVSTVLSGLCSDYAAGPCARVAKLRLFAVGPAASASPATKPARAPR
jgi:hypothetical protein